MSNQFAGRQNGGARIMRGGANYTVKLGQYVVTPNNQFGVGWVYDVIIQNFAGKEIAFVSFTQEPGFTPLRWIGMNWKSAESMAEYKDYGADEHIIKELARNYAINKGVQVK
jgi:hypothetical protein